MSRTGEFTDGMDRLEVYPPGRWGSRPEPTAGDVDAALETAGNWWPWAVNRADDSIQSFIDLFERYLSSEVRSRVKKGDPGQLTINAVADGGNSPTDSTDTEGSQ